MNFKIFVRTVTKLVLLETEAGLKGVHSTLRITMSTDAYYHRKSFTINVYQASTFQLN